MEEVERNKMIRPKKHRTIKIKIVQMCEEVNSKLTHDSFNVYIEENKENGFFTVQTEKGLWNMLKEEIKFKVKK